jgi:hypothetical protein
MEWLRNDQETSCKRTGHKGTISPLTAVKGERLPILKMTLPNEQLAYGRFQVAA